MCVLQVEEKSTYALQELTSFICLSIHNIALDKKMVIRWRDYQRLDNAFVITKTCST